MIVGTLFMAVIMSVWVIILELQKLRLLLVNHSLELGNVRLDRHLCMHTHINTHTNPDMSNKSSQLMWLCNCLLLLGALLGGLRDFLPCSEPSSLSKASKTSCGVLRLVMVVDLGKILGFERALFRGILCKAVVRP